MQGGRTISVQAAAAARGLEAKEATMCYELSGWFTQLRSADRARQQQTKTQPVAEPPQRAPEPQPVAPETRVKERETAPA